MSGTRVRSDGARHVVALWLATVVVGLSALVAVPAVAGAQPSGEAEHSRVVLELYWVDGCPHCASEKAWLAGIEEHYPYLEVRAYEVAGSRANAVRLGEVADQLGFDPVGVPVTVIGERYWVGFGETTAAQIEAVVAAAAPTVSDAPVQGPSAAEESAASDTSVDVPVLGDVDLADRSLLLSTALIGFLDGFNPCSLWVLSVLLALVLHTGSRRRVLLVGGTFLAVTAGLYGVYIAGLLSVLATIAYVAWIRIGVAAVATGFGIVNVKDYFFFRRGPSLTIADRHKPGIYRRIRRLARGDGSVAGLLGGTAVLAVGVSLAETPCTAGFPVIWANLLADRGVELAGAAALFGVYMLVFLLDELAVFGIAVVTMRAAKLQERHGRLLKLASGMVMLALAGVMLAGPHLLESVTGTLAVFGGAAVATGLVVVGDRWSGRRGRSEPRPVSR